MKKKFIILIFIIGFIFLLWYIADNYLFSYNYDFDIDKIYEETIRDTENSTDISEDPSSTEDTNEDINEDTESSDEDEGDDEASKDLSSSNGTSRTKPITPEEHEQQIIDEYTAKFSALRDISLSRINALISQALDEYNNTPDNKKNSAKVTLGYKYLRLGRSLEKEIDAKFNSILSDMRNKLKKNNLPTTSINEAQKTYDNEKAERRSYLMEKALSN